MASLAQAWCHRWYNDDPHDRLLVLSGLPGCGKTHIAQRVWAWAQLTALTRWEHLRCPSDALPTVHFADWFKLADDDRCTVSMWDNFVRGAGAYSLFVLDDIGAETDRYRTGVPTARLCELLNTRANKFTLITTNVPFAKWRERWDARVEDRLLRNAVIFQAEAPSFAVSKPAPEQFGNHDVIP